MSECRACKGCGRIVGAVLDDLLNWRGFRQTWDEMSVRDRSDLASDLAVRVEAEIPEAGDG